MNEIPTITRFRSSGKDWFHIGFHQGPVTVMVTYSLDEMLKIQAMLREVLLSGYGAAIREREGEATSEIEEEARHE